LVLPQPVYVYGAIGSSRWIGQTRRRGRPRFHDAHLVPIARDQVVGVADCRSSFKRNRQCPEVSEEYRSGRAIGGGEQHGDISPDWRPAFLDEFLQSIQGRGLIQADDYGQTN
jgi:hypothetical protein